MSFLDSGKPIFTDTLIGWLKVLGLLFSGVTVVIGSIWYFISGALAARVKKVEDSQIEVEKDMTTLKTKVETLDRDVLVLTNDVKGMDESYGMLNTQVQRYIDTTDRLREDIHKAERNIIDRLGRLEGAQTQNRRHDDN